MNQGFLITLWLDAPGAKSASVLRDIVFPVVSQDPNGYLALQFAIRGRLIHLREGTISPRKVKEQITLLVHAVLSNPRWTAQNRVDFWTLLLRRTTYFLGRRPDLAFALLSDAVAQAGGRYLEEFNSVLRGLHADDTRMQGDPHHVSPLGPIRLDIFGSYLDTQRLPRSGRP